MLENRRHLVVRTFHNLHHGNTVVNVTDRLISAATRELKSTAIAKPAASSEDELMRLPEARRS